MLILVEFFVLSSICLHLPLLTKAVQICTETFLRGFSLYVECEQQTRKHVLGGRHRAS